MTRATLGVDADAACALAQQRTRIFSLRPLRTTAVLWCEADALQAAGAAAGAGTVAATFGPSAPVHAHQKLGGAPHIDTQTTSSTVSSELKVNVQDVARLCSRKSHVKVGRRLRAARRLQLGWVGAFAGRVVTFGMSIQARLLSDQLSEAESSRQPERGLKRTFWKWSRDRKGGRKDFLLTRQRLLGPLGPK